jgi:hypothetical protein
MRQRRARGEQQDRQVERVAHVGVGAVHDERPARADGDGIGPRPSEGAPGAEVQQQPRGRQRHAGDRLRG